MTKSISDLNEMQRSLIKLNEACGVQIQGIRQHRLLWKHPLTACIQEKIGLTYDSTLGFAAHEGFRNSYCLPFKLYDFDNDRMLNLWEFPLTVMDVTLFAYQQYSVEEAFKKCQLLLEEIINFGGVFTLLWHNTFFDEQTYPGVRTFYENLLMEINQKQGENIVGNELQVRMNNL